MSKFDKIAKIRENFDDKLYQVDEFKTTKGILYDFGNYIKEHKEVLIALLAATSINALSQLSVIKDMDFGSLLSTQTQYETVINQPSNPMPTELVVKSDFSGIDMKSDLAIFTNNSKLANAITNTKYLGQDIPQLNLEGIHSIKTMPEHTPVMFKNPFWENNVIEIENTSIGSRFYHSPSRVDADLHSVNVLSNNTTQRLLLDFKEIEAIADFIGVPAQDRDLILKYTVYHEAAHGSFHQSHEFNKSSQMDNREVDVESHADMASVMMIASESKNIHEFNKIVDYAIKFRMKRMETDISHNSTYALAELKQLVNKNPELLNMKQSDISTFTANIADQVKYHAFSDTELLNLKEYGVDFSKSKILDDFNNNRNDTLYQSMSGFMSPNFNIKKIQSMPQEVRDRKFNGAAARFSAEFQQSARHDVITSMINAHNNWDLEKSAKDLNDYVKNHSILDQGMNNAIDYKVQMETLSSLKNNQSMFTQKQQSIVEAKQTTNNTFKI
jgi:hypothetical protein